jgi:hypothetical protein
MSGKSMEGDVWISMDGPRDVRIYMEGDVGFSMESINQSINQSIIYSREHSILGTLLLLYRCTFSGHV